jgi:hypothetical protein
MRHGNVVGIDMVFGTNAGTVLSQMRHDLVAVKVEVDPTI